LTQLLVDVDLCGGGYRSADAEPERAVAICKKG
jgi:hypothetical protein